MRSSELCLIIYGFLLFLELSVNTAAFAKSAAMLGNSEDHTALSRALSQLAEVEEKIDMLHQEQAFADFYVFSELLSDYVRLISAVKVRLRFWETIPNFFTALKAVIIAQHNLFI